MSPRFATLQPICRITASSLRRLALVIVLAGAGSVVLANGDAAPEVAATAADTAAKKGPSEAYDLGEGLGYVRVHSFTQDGARLTAALSASTALVIDCRYTKDTPVEPEALERAFTARKPDAFLALLVTNETGKLYLVFSALSPKLIALTPSGAPAYPHTSVVVTQPADVDRRAYDGLDSGMPLEALITGKIEKERFDEAELVKEFENGNANAAPPPEPDPSKPVAEKAPVLTDRVLQRAVHLHRALLALKRG